MKSFEYLHKLFVHKNNQCYQTCWLCNDFRNARGNLRSYPILRLWTPWSPVESRISRRVRSLRADIKHCGSGPGNSSDGQWPVWPGQAGPVLWAGSWAGTGPAGSELRLGCPAQSGAHLCSSQQRSPTPGEQQVTGDSGDMDQNYMPLSNMTQQTDLVRSFWVVEGISRWHIGKIKSYDSSTDDQQIFLDSSLTADQWKVQFSLVWNVICLWTVDWWASLVSRACAVVTGPGPGESVSRPRAEPGPAPSPGQPRCRVCWARCGDFTRGGNFSSLRPLRE